MRKGVTSLTVSYLGIPLHRNGFFFSCQWRILMEVWQPNPVPSLRPFFQMNNMANQEIIFRRTGP